MFCELKRSKEMTSPFAWGVKSPMPQANYMGSRFPDSDKIFSQLVPVQMQLPSGEERKRFLRLNVELVSSGLSATSFRKVCFEHHFMCSGFQALLPIGPTFWDNRWRRSLHLLYLENVWGGLFCFEISARSFNRFHSISHKVCPTLGKMFGWTSNWITKVFPTVQITLSCLVMLCFS